MKFRWSITKHKNCKDWRTGEKYDEQEYVAYEAITTPTIGANTLPGNSVVQHIYVPANSVNAYKTAFGWNSYADKITAISE